MTKFAGSLVEQYVWNERRLRATIIFANHSSLRLLLNEP